MMYIITGHKGLYQPLIYAQHKEKKQIIKTQSLQCHKLLLLPQTPVHD